MDPERIIVFVGQKREAGGKRIVEEWAARIGFIVTNIRQPGPQDVVICQGVEIKRERDKEIWLADIVISERERDLP